MIDAALIADGGELSVMRPLAAYAFGAWTVNWPEGFDAPELDDSRRLGFVADLPDGRKPGRLSRRFIRVDAEIDAVEGTSNVEEILDDAATRTAGREFFEREIGPAGFGRLVPGVDVKVNDRRPVLLWGRILDRQLVTGLVFGADGTATGHVGGQPVSDDLRRLALNRENDQRILAERRENDERVRSVSVAARSAIQKESEAREAGLAAEAESRKEGLAAEAEVRKRELDSEARKREADLKKVREYLGGAGASESSLLSQLAAINAQIVGMSDGEVLAPGLLNSYMSANTLLWNQQQEINRINSKFQVEVRERQAEDQKLWEKQSEIDAEQTEQALSLDRRAPLFFTGGPSGRVDSDLGLRVEVSGDLRTIKVSNSKAWSGRCLLSVNVYALNNFSFHESFRLSKSGSEVSFRTGGSSENIRDWLLIVVRD